MKTLFWPEFKGFRDIDLGLDRMCKALERLNNPHKNLPKTIHIAGTNGKGSTLAFLKSILQNNEYKVHTYSSPHLVNFNERITLAGKEIKDSALNEYLQICKNSCERSPKIELTFFEGTTLAAFLAFSKIEADFLILETGMGGRLDATNVLDHVMASIITPIAIDHSEFLGNSLQKITYEKSGIIKNNSIVISSQQNSKCLDQIKQYSKEKNSLLYCFANDFRYEVIGDKFIFACDFFSDNKSLNDKIVNNELTFDTPTHLNDEHQFENLSTALATLIACNIDLDCTNINQGIKDAYWPARLEKITSGYFCNLANEKISKNKNYKLYLDGGHNPAAAKIIKNFLNLDDSYKILIFSILDNKDYFAFLTEIKDSYDFLIFCDIKESANVNFSEVEKVLASQNVNFSYQKDIKDAFNYSLDLTNGSSKDSNLILICGSLYLAGDFLEINNI